MMLIADSGSTKTIWHLIDLSGNIETCITDGINPFFMEEEDILTLLNTSFRLDTNVVSSVYFYGAGCALPEKKAILQKALTRYFPKKASVTIESDLLGTARSLCQNSQGIACILGTGSNSCLYDGRQIVQNVSPLGYILGDEGSGAVLGRQLLSDILKNQLPPAVCQAFFDEYKISQGEILDSVYRQPFPNRFMAQYTQFMAQNIDIPEINAMINTSFEAFFQRNILQYEEAGRYPLFFTGSIASVFRQNLEETARSFGLKIKGIEADPMNGLVTYHRTHLVF